MGWGSRLKSYRFKRNTGLTQVKWLRMGILKATIYIALFRRPRGGGHGLRATGIGIKTGKYWLKTVHLASYQLY